MWKKMETNFLLLTPKNFRANKSIIIQDISWTIVAEEYIIYFEQITN